MTRGSCILGLVLAALAPAAPAGTTVFEHVTLIDGTGRAAEPDMAVVVDGERIALVTPARALPRTAGRHIDGRGLYLMPGLMDVHIHLRGAAAQPGADGSHAVDFGVAHAALASFLYAGVTTVVDVGNQPELILKVRADERAGLILAPRILATGNLITTPGGHADAYALRITDFERDRPLLDRHIAEQQPDILKLTYDEEGWGARPMIPLLPLELMHQIIRYYNLHGIRTTVHVSNENRALEAIYAGTDTLAHPVIQAPVSDSFVRLMAAKQTPFATTLTIGESYSRLVEHPEYLDEPLYVASFSRAERDALRGAEREALRARTWTWWMKLMTPICEQNIAKIVAAGGVAALGTDQSSGPAVHRELELLAAAGIPPAEIIRIATLNAAIFLGRERDMGSIAAGKLADLVLLRADPSADVGNAKAIALVMKAGSIIDESRLPLAGGPQPRRWPAP
jgi:imidazolonepropionase-like amidohydrolase